MVIQRFAQVPRICVDIGQPAENPAIDIIRIITKSPVDFFTRLYLFLLKYPVIFSKVTLSINSSGAYISQIIV